MKSTGIVRRIDELGRIVIPKEIRRNLRIRDSEMLEIFVDNDMIVLKKYSKLSDTVEIAKKLSDILYHTLNKNIFVTDFDTFIAVSGGLKKKYIGGQLSSFLENLLKNKVVSKSNSLVEIELIEKKKELCSYMSSPICVNGDVVGLVLITSECDDFNDLDEILINIASQMLGKYVED